MLGLVGMQDKGLQTRHERLAVSRDNLRDQSPAWGVWPGGNSHRSCQFSRRIEDWPQSG